MFFFRMFACFLLSACLCACTQSPSNNSSVPKDNKKTAVEPALNPNFPVVEGKYQITKEWSISLPGKFNRRFEDNSLVIWRPGLTAWIVVWNNNKMESAKQRCEYFRKEINPDAFALEERTDGPILRFSYRLTEKRDA